MSVKLGETDIAGLGAALPSQVGNAGKYLYTDGQNAIWKEASVDPDNSTITKNSSDELQAVATLNANTATGATNPVYDWVGTLAEYNAQNIETLHPDWVCYITDDADGGDSVYTKSEVDAITSDKANVDMDNLTSTGTNIGNWSSNVTNCITKIPQDIKLELNAGTLTLKAGSKVYVPNGVDVFDTLNIESDLTVTITSDDTYMVFVNTSGPAIGYRRLATQTGSGTSTPTTSYWAYYNTTDNKIYVINNGVKSGQFSLPLAIITVSGGAITSIDQVFNGFGYIGIAVFILPGVSALIPNGLNSDGSCKNIAFTNPSVYVYNIPTVVERNVGLITDSTGTIINFENSGTSNTFVGLAQNRPTTVANTLNNYWYSTDENQWYNTSGSTTANWQKAYPVFLGKRNGTATSTTYFEQKSAFSAADRSDREFFAHQAMPSNRYVDLTLGTSGATYLAPADGYVCIDKSATAAGQYLQINFHNMVASQLAVGSGNRVRVYALVRKNSYFGVAYNVGGTTNFFRFVYAAGATKE